MKALSKNTKKNQIIILNMKSFQILQQQTAINLQHLKLIRCHALQISMIFSMMRMTFHREAKIKQRSIQASGGGEIARLTPKIFPIKWSSLFHRGSQIIRIIMKELAACDPRLKINRSQTKTMTILNRTHKVSIR